MDAKKCQILSWINHNIADFGDVGLRYQDKISDAELRQ